MPYFDATLRFSLLSASALLMLDIFLQRLLRAINYFDTYVTMLSFAIRAIAYLRHAARCDAITLTPPPLPDYMHCFFFSCRFFFAFRLLLALIFAMPPCARRHHFRCSPLLLMPC